MLQKRKVKEGRMELVANQIYDKITTPINKSRERLGIKGGDKIVEPTEIMIVSIQTTMVI